MIDYTGLTDEQAHAQRRADRGIDWIAADSWDDARRFGLADTIRQALHDRDRFQRERDYWREECIKLTGEALA